jgi:hypothetical protein
MMMEHTTKKVEHNTFFWVSVTFFVIFYPMLISIYVFLPLFIGAMSYILIRGLEKNSLVTVFMAIIYLLNLEVNLSLPLFLTLIASFLFYVMIYHSLLHFRKCKICKPLLSVIILDLMYLGALFSFDFIFQTQSIFLDNILLYSLVVDMLIVVLL